MADLPANDVLQCHAIWSIWLVQAWPEGFWLSTFCLGKQVGDGDSQGLGQEKCFLVGDATDASLYLGQGSPGDVQAHSLAFCRELLLGEVELAPQLANLASCDVRGQGSCSISGT